MKKNLSALKRDQLSIRNRMRNKVYKKAIKISIKKYVMEMRSSSNNESALLSGYLSIVYKQIDKAVQKGVIHKNKGARKKSHLAKMLYKNS
uniref:Ribosomal protein S20 n=1 Tax=Wrangelia sp. TaxID=2575620 RepID=A0A4D6WZM3_9FLOR|nr:ribosomal protein S20 [Wrangelia sp.]